MANSDAPTVEDTDHLGVAAWAALLRTHAAVVRVLDREVRAATGLPLASYDVLLELNAAPDRRLRMQQLADRVVLSRTRVSRLVDEMAGAGLVVKSPDPGDGRAVLASITERGRKELGAAAPVYLAGIRKHFTAHLSRTQLDAIRQGLESVLAVHGQGEPRQNRREP